MNQHQRFIHPKTVECHRIDVDSGLSVDCGNCVFYTTGFVFLRLVFLSIYQNAEHHGQRRWVAQLAWVPLSVPTNHWRMVGSLSYCIMANQKASEGRFYTNIAPGLK